MEESQRYSAENLAKQMSMAAQLTAMIKRFTNQDQNNVFFEREDPQIVNNTTKLKTALQKSLLEDLKTFAREAVTAGLSTQRLEDLQAIVLDGNSTYASERTQQLQKIVDQDLLYTSMVNGFSQQELIAHLAQKDAYDRVNNAIRMTASNGYLNNSIEKFLVSNYSDIVDIHKLYNVKWKFFSQQEETHSRHALHVKNNSIFDDTILTIFNDKEMLEQASELTAGLNSVYFRNIDRTSTALDITKQVLLNPEKLAQLINASQAVLDQLDSFTDSQETNTVLAQREKMLRPFMNLDHDQRMMVYIMLATRSGQMYSAQDNDLTDLTSLDQYEQHKQKHQQMFMQLRGVATEIMHIGSKALFAKQSDNRVQFATNDEDVVESYASAQEMYNSSHTSKSGDDFLRDIISVGIPQSKLFNSVESKAMQTIKYMAYKNSVLERVNDINQIKQQVEAILLDPVDLKRLDNNGELEDSLNRFKVSIITENLFDKIEKVGRRNLHEIQQGVERTNILFDEITQAVDNREQRQKLREAFDKINAQKISKLLQSAQNNLNEKFDYANVISLVTDQLGESAFRGEILAATANDDLMNYDLYGIQDTAQDDEATKQQLKKLAQLMQQANIPEERADSLIDDMLRHINSLKPDNYKRDIRTAFTRDSFVKNFVGEGTVFNPFAIEPPEEEVTNAMLKDITDFKGNIDQMMIRMLGYADAMVTLRAETSERDMDAFRKNIFGEQGSENMMRDLQNMERMMRVGMLKDQNFNPVPILKRAYYEQFNPLGAGVFTTAYRDSIKPAQVQEVLKNAIDSGPDQDFDNGLILGMTDQELTHSLKYLVGERNINVTEEHLETIAGVLKKNIDRSQITQRNLTSFNRVVPLLLEAKTVYGLVKDSGIDQRVFESHFLTPTLQRDQIENMLQVQSKIKKNYDIDITGSWAGTNYNILRRAFKGTGVLFLTTSALGLAYTKMASDLKDVFVSQLPQGVQRYTEALERQGLIDQAFGYDPDDALERPSQWNLAVMDNQQTIQFLDQLRSGVGEQQLVLPPEFVNLQIVNDMIRRENTLIPRLNRQLLDETTFNKMSRSILYGDMLAQSQNINESSMIVERLKQMSDQGTGLVGPEAAAQQLIADSVPQINMVNNMLATRSSEQNAQLMEHMERVEDFLSDKKDRDHTKYTLPSQLPHMIATSANITDEDIRKQAQQRVADSLADTIKSVQNQVREPVKQLVNASDKETTMDKKLEAIKQFDLEKQREQKFTQSRDLFYQSMLDFNALKNFVFEEFDDMMSAQDALSARHAHEVSTMFLGNLNDAQKALREVFSQRQQQAQGRGKEFEAEGELRAYHKLNNDLQAMSHSIISNLNNTDTSPRDKLRTLKQLINSDLSLGMQITMTNIQQIENTQILEEYIDIMHDYMFSNQSLQQLEDVGLGIDTGDVSQLTLDITGPRIRPSVRVGDFDISKNDLSFEQAMQAYKERIDRMTERIQEMEYEMENEGKESLKANIERMWAERAGVQAMQQYLIQMNKNESDMLGLTNVVFNQMSKFQVNDMLNREFQIEFGDSEETKRYKRTGRDLMNQYMAHAEMFGAKPLNQLTTEKFIRDNGLGEDRDYVRAIIDMAKTQDKMSEAMNRVMQVKHFEDTQNHYISQLQKSVDPRKKFVYQTGSNARTFSMFFSLAATIAILGHRAYLARKAAQYVSKQNKMIEDMSTLIKEQARGILSKGIQTVRRLEDQIPSALQVLEEDQLMSISESQLQKNKLLVDLVKYQAAKANSLLQHARYFQVNSEQWRFQQRQQAAMNNAALMSHNLLPIAQSSRVPDIEVRTNLENIPTLQNQMRNLSREVQEGYKRVTNTLLSAVGVLTDKQIAARDSFVNRFGNQGDREANEFIKQTFYDHNQLVSSILQVANQALRTVSHLSGNGQLYEEVSAVLRDVMPTIPVYNPNGQGLSEYQKQLRKSQQYMQRKLLNLEMMEQNIRSAAQQPEHNQMFRDIYGSVRQEQDDTRNLEKKARAYEEMRADFNDRAKVLTPKRRRQMTLPHFKDMLETQIQNSTDKQKVRQIMLNKQRRKQRAVRQFTSNIVKQIRQLQNKVALQLEGVKRKRIIKAQRKIINSKKKVLFNVSEEEMMYHTEHRKRVNRARKLKGKTLAPSLLKHRTYIEEFMDGVTQDLYESGLLQLK